MSRVARVVRRPVRWMASAVASAAVVTAREVVQRIGPAAVLLRGVVWVTGFAASLLAVPGSWAGRFPVLLAAAVAAALPAAAPGTWLVLALELAAAGGWLLRTLGTSIAWAPLMALAAALYLHHLSGALAARLPGEALLVAGVLRRWIARAAWVLAVTGVLAAVALGLDDRIDRVSTVVVPVVGVVLAVTVAGYLALVWRRDPP